MRKKRFFFKIRNFLKFNINVMLFFGGGGFIIPEKMVIND